MPPAVPLGRPWVRFRRRPSNAPNSRLSWPRGQPNSLAVLDAPGPGKGTRPVARPRGVPQRLGIYLRQSTLVPMSGEPSHFNARAMARWLASRGRPHAKQPPGPRPTLAELIWKRGVREVICSIKVLRTRAATLRSLLRRCRSPESFSGVRWAQTRLSANIPACRRSWPMMSLDTDQRRPLRDRSSECRRRMK
jgi:hypothetical protein